MIQVVQDLKEKTDKWKEEKYKRNNIRKED